MDRIILSPAKYDAVVRMYGKKVAEARCLKARKFHEYIGRAAANKAMAKAMKILRKGNI